MMPARRDLSGVPSADPAALFAALRPEINDPVRGLDDVQVVLDDNHRVAGVHKAVQHAQQLANVVEVQAGRRLVEDVHRPAGRLLYQFASQLDTLRLAAGKGGARLADLDVIQAASCSV